MMLGLSEADCAAAGARREELRSEAGRRRSAGNRAADRPARSPGFGSAGHGIAALVARTGMRPRRPPEASSTTAAPPAALGTAR